MTQFYTRVELDANGDYCPRTFLMTEQYAIIITGGCTMAPGKGCTKLWLRNAELHWGKKGDSPTVGVIDSQSVKSTQKTENKGFDAGKKTKGVKRHIVTDTNGLVLAINVHSASLQDRDGAKETLMQAKASYPTLERFFADGGYSGKLQNWCLLNTKTLLSIVKRHTEKFEILPIRWIVERTFGWMNNFRRLSKHYEHTCNSAKAQVEIAMIKLMVKRLTDT